MEVIIDTNFGIPLGSTRGETLLGFSDAAVRKMKAIRHDEGNPDLMLRVSVYGGGCSGFQYTFSLEDEIKPADRTVEKDGVTLIIDQSSYQMLAGSEVDYSEGLEGALFVVHNPNASSTCGCGASFSI